MFTTHITKKECIDNLDDSARNSYSYLKKKLRDFNKDAKVLKNFSPLKDFFEIDVTLDFSNELEKIKDRLSDIFIDHFQEITIDSNKTQKIIGDYFSQNPPFTEGKKKYEFPDALVLNSLESWCEKKKQKIYVVSDDKDFLSYKSDYLIPTNEYDKLLDQITFTYGDENISRKIVDNIHAIENAIINNVESEFKDQFPWGGFDETQGFEYDTNELVSFHGYIHHLWILELSDTSAKVEISINADFEVDITYQDNNTGWYDKEDRRWYGVESINTVVKENCELKVITDIEFEVMGKEIELVEWEIDEVSGIPENIDIVS